MERNLRVAINGGSIAERMTGIGHYTANLLAGLDSLPGTGEYLALKQPSPPVEGWPRLQHIRELAVTPHGPMWEQLELPTLLEDVGAAVYHNPAFGLPVVKTAKLVCTLHDCIPRLFPECAPTWLRDFFTRWAPTWLRLADHIICVSEHTRHDAVHLYGVNPSRTTVVYQSTAASLSRVAERAQVDQVKGRFGIDGPYVLMVGRVELRKNVAGMLEAIEIVRAHAPGPLLLVLAGPRDADTHDPQCVLPAVGRHGDTVVTGYVSPGDLAALYTGCGVFCFPSFYEGFGIPVLEAMRCGAPVVTSRVSSLPEVGGDACCYVDPYDPQSIADGVLKVLTDRDEARGMRERGFVRASEFTLARFAGQTQAVYERVAKGSGEEATA